MKSALVVPVCMLALCSLARADDSGMSDYYVSGSFGFNAQVGDPSYNWGSNLTSASGEQPSWSIFSASDIKFDSSTAMGVAVVGALGKKFDNGLRVEIEGSYRNNEVDDFHFAAGPANSFGTQGRISTAAAMVNALYEFDLGPVRPYIGGGIGIARLTYSDVGGHSDSFAFANEDMLIVADDAQWSLAYQGIVGVALPLQQLPHLELTAEYRYLGTPDADINVWATVGGSKSEKSSMSVDNGNHSAMLGIRYNF